MIESFVQRVRDAYDTAFPDERASRGYGCTFHLRACYCGAPTWQQPCPTCGYYPMYGSTGSSCEKDSATRAEFVARASAHGGVAALYFAEFRRTVGYARNPVFASRIDALVNDAKTWTDVPTPGQIWDFVRGHPQSEESR